MQKKIESPYKSQKVKVASVAWKIKDLSDEEEFFEHLVQLVDSAVKAGAELVVLPELFELELLSLYGDGDESAVAQLLLPYAAKIERKLSELARKNSIIIVGGSHLKLMNNKKIGNFCPIVFPNREIYFQPKNVRTYWEIKPWNIAEFTGLITLPWQKLGVLVCYDSEFPEASRVHAESGVELLCVPSYTESQKGYQRVNFSAKARAVENEIFVVQASLVGPIERFGLGTAYGISSIMTPSKNPFPDSAVLAETILNQEGVAVAELDFKQLVESRNSGDARPWNDRHNSNWDKNIEFNLKSAVGL